MIFYKTAGWKLQKYIISQIRITQKINFKRGCYMVQPLLYSTGGRRMYSPKLSLAPKQQLVFPTDLIYVKQALTTLQM